MRIGTRIHTDWLGSDDDHDLKFLKQIGVDYVDITLDMVKGYTETGCFEKSDLLELIDRLEDSELKIERANSLGPYYRDAHTCGPNAQQEIDNLCKIAEMLGEVEVPVFGIQCCQASISVEGRTGWTQKQGRGGYGYPSFDLKEAQGVSYEPEKKYTAEQLWEGLLNIYRQVIPVAESSGTNVAMHGNDPPLYEHWGNPQILCRYADFDRLFQEVPSTTTQ